MADLMMLRGELARALAETGLPIHQCTAPSHLRRLGGICLVPATATSPDDLDGIIVCWTPHDALARDVARPGLAGQVRHELNHALGRLVDRLGFVAEPFGPGASLVTGHRVPTTSSAVAAGAW